VLLTVLQGFVIPLRESGTYYDLASSIYAGWTIYSYEEHIQFNVKFRVSNRESKCEH
jgi:hypothetical protein